METVEGVIQVKEDNNENPRSTQELYLRILGVDKMPPSPKEMPGEVFLPPEALGDLEGAILALRNDGLERSQLIKWDSKQGRFIYSKLRVGAYEDSGDGSVADILSSAYFKNKALVQLHTHPFGIYYFSARDVAISTRLPRLSFIGIVGSRNRIRALLQTEQSAKLPLSSIWKGLKTEHNLTRRGFESDVSEKQMARMVEELGYGYYKYDTPNESITRGELDKGIKLLRVS